MNACDGCAGGIFFADAASNHGGCGKAEAEANGHDETEKRLGEANGGDRVGAKTANPENVDDREKGFQDHFHNHGNGEEENGAIQVASGEVLVRAAKGFPNGAPNRRRRRGDSSLFRWHIDLYVLRGASQDTRALPKLSSRRGREDQFRASGGLDAYSDLRGEHGRCPWRCLCELTAPELRISTDLIGTTRFYLERVPCS